MVAVPEQGPGVAIQWSDGYKRSAPPIAIAWGARAAKQLRARRKTSVAEYPASEAVGE
jgi:L-asparaginase II